MTPEYVGGFQTGCRCICKQKSYLEISIRPVGHCVTSVYLLYWRASCLIGSRALPPRILVGPVRRGARERDHEAIQTQDRKGSTRARATTVHDRRWRRASPMLRGDRQGRPSI